MAEFPVIDLVRLTEQAGNEEGRLMAACSKTGFFYVTNHGILQEDIDTMFNISKELFELPLDIKEKYDIRDNIGYIRMGKERLSSMDLVDYKESFNLPSSITLASDVQIPPTIKDNYKSVEAFTRACQEVGRRILRGLATGLHLDPNYFSQAHQYGELSSGIFRMLCYPAVPDTVDQVSTIRAGSHSDYGSLTLLFQESPPPNCSELASGLQVCIQDTWYDVPAKSGCIVVNIADLLSFWSEGRLRSAVHHVILPSNELRKSPRHSLVFFMHPHDDHIIRPIPSSIPAPFPAEKDEHGNLVATFGPSPFIYHRTGKEYLLRRLNLTYNFATT